MNQFTNYLSEPLKSGNSLLDFLIVIAIIVVALLLAKTVHAISTGIAKKIKQDNKRQLALTLLEKVKTPFMLSVLFITSQITLVRLEQPETSREMVTKFFSLLIVLMCTWLVARFTTSFIAQVLDRRARKSDGKADTHIVNILQKVSVYIIWMIGFIMALNVFGVKVSALVAGLGIGSMAFAFAAQDTIKNLIGGFTLFVDNPFRIGERIKIESVDGFVQDIGMRSLRIKTLDNRIVSIPNSKVVDSTLENITSQPSAKIKNSLGLTYDTPIEKMQQAIDLLKTIPSTVNGIETEVSATFNSYGDFSMNILFVYYIKPTADYFETIGAVNMEILRLFNANGLDFAFPTQTLYVNK